MLVQKDRDNFYILNWLDQYMIGHKGFIAGGCFKNIFNGEKVKDLDIFFDNAEDWSEAVHYFTTMTPGYTGEDKRNEWYVLHYQNSKVTAFKNTKTGIVVELCCAVYGSPEYVLSQFDFTITKFAYYKEEVEYETDEILESLGVDTTKTLIEYKILCDDCFFEHLHTHRLVTDDKILYPMSTFERMIRYITYGYRPCRETKMKIAKALHDIPDATIEANASLYDGMD